MKSAPFSYVAPTSVEEACSVLAQHGEDARLLAGGQSLGAMLNMRLVTPRVIVDVNRIAGLDLIELHGSQMSTGALVRQAEALQHPTLGRHVPLLAMALPHVGHYQTRSRGTLAGSLAHADPSAEIPLLLVVLDGDVELQAGRHCRRVKGREFFTSALVTTRRPEEMIVAVHWPVAAASDRYGFREFAMRGGDYALVVAACAVRLSSAGAVERISLGFSGCSDRPQLVDTVGWQGARPSAALVVELANKAADEIDCKGDLHASARYRRQLVRSFAESLLTETLAPND